MFVGVHVGALLLDPYVHFGISDVFLPLASRWHPVAVAWGVVGLYVLLAVELTSLAKARLPRRVWRAVHVAALPLFFVATVHFAATGTDAGNPIAVVAMVLAVVVVAALLLRRFRRPAPAARRRIPTARSTRRLAAWRARRGRVLDGPDGGPDPGEVEHVGEVPRVAIADAQRRQRPAPLDHAEDRRVLERLPSDDHPGRRERRHHDARDAEPELRVVGVWAGRWG